MKAHLTHTMVALVSMILCAVAALFIPPLWEGVSGRDFRPQSRTMAILIFLLAAFLRAALRWQIVEFVAGLACAEFVTLCVIAFFSGFTWSEIFDRFNLSWLGTMSVFIAAPWLLGLFVGNLLLKARRKQLPNRPF